MTKKQKAQHRRAIGAERAKRWRAAHPDTHKARCKDWHEKRRPQPEKGEDWVAFMLRGFIESPKRVAHPNYRRPKVAPPNAAPLTAQEIIEAKRQIAEDLKRSAAFYRSLQR